MSVQRLAAVAIGSLLLLAGVAPAQPAPEPAGPTGPPGAAGRLEEPEAELPRSRAGFIRLPASGKGWYCYGKVERRWGTPAVVYGIMRVAARWDGVGPAMGVGDISVAEGGPVWSIGRRGRRTLAHKTHRDGKCVDVRPVRNDGQTGPVTIGQSTYSRELTGRLIELFREELAVKEVLFLDRRVGDVRRVKNHHHHFHVTAR